MSRAKKPSIGEDGLTAAADEDDAAATADSAWEVRARLVDGPEEAAAAETESDELPCSSSIESVAWAAWVEEDASEAAAAERLLPAAAAMLLA